MVIVSCPLLKGYALPVLHQYSLMDSVAHSRIGDNEMCDTMVRHLLNHAGPAGVFAQEVTVSPLNMSQSEYDIRRGRIMGTRIFNKNLHI